MCFCKSGQSVRVLENENNTISFYKLFSYSALLLRYSHLKLEPKKHFSKISPILLIKF